MSGSPDALGGILVPDMKSDTPVEALAQVLAGHAALLWGAPRAADLQDSLTQAAQTLMDVRQQLPDSDTEPGCYPAAESGEAAAQ